MPLAIRIPRMIALLFSDGQVIIATVICGSCSVVYIGGVMTATALQAWIAVAGALLAGVLGIFRYFTYRTRRDRISLVGQAFNSTVEGLSSDADAKKLAAAILLRRFFDKETEQGAVGKPYEREAIAVIAALLRNTPAGELQKLLADGLAMRQA
jgi:ABC-type nickel/cobalt efflux system permease component RcnA